jgi:hypothetical protein
MLTGVKCAGCVGAMRFPKGKDRASMGLPPDFLSTLIGFEKLHAAFLNESRTRGSC